MNIIDQIYNYLPSIKALYLQAYGNILEYKLISILILIILILLYRQYRFRKRILKKKRYKKAKLVKKKIYYNTGYRFEVCLKDIIKLKIRLADYCDKKGCRYSYLFNIKLFGLEFLRAKIIDQKGHVYKRKITFRG